MAIGRAAQEATAAVVILPTLAPVAVRAVPQADRAKLAALLAPRAVVRAIIRPAATLRRDVLPLAAALLELQAAHHRIEAVAIQAVLLLLPRVAIRLPLHVVVAAAADALAAIRLAAVAAVAAADVLAAALVAAAIRREALPNLAAARIPVVAGAVAARRVVRPAVAILRDPLAVAVPHRVHLAVEAPRLAVAAVAVDTDKMNAFHLGFQ